MEVEDLIPDYTAEYLQFTDRFGDIYVLVPSYSKLCYSTVSGENYLFPNNVTKEMIDTMYKKSLVDNKDYVLEYVRKNGTKLEIKKGQILWV